MVREKRYEYCAGLPVGSRVSAAYLRSEIQYLAVGAAVVASPVGMNKQVIQDGQNGFLAKDQQQWFKRLSELIEQPELRKRLTRQGRVSVEKSYSLHQLVPKFLQILAGFKDRRANEQD